MKENEIMAPMPETASDKTDNPSNDIETRDELFEEAAKYIVSLQQGSTASLQRHFSIGYNRAGRIMEQLEKAGVISKSNGDRPREVLIKDIKDL